jgi:hypothetical protein
MEKGRRTARLKSCPDTKPSGSGQSAKRVSQLFRKARQRRDLETLERAFRGAMNPRKRSGIQQQGPQNSSASWRRIQQERIRATQQVVTGGTVSRKRASSGATASEPRTRPEHTAAGSKNQHGATRNAVFPGQMVMGLLDASKGACGGVCLRERVRVFAASLRKTPAF